MISALDEQAQASVYQRSEGGIRRPRHLGAASCEPHPLFRPRARDRQQQIAGAGSPTELAERNDSLLTLLAAAE
jgi:hypothetical protein